MVVDGGGKREMDMAMYVKELRKKLKRKKELKKAREELRMKELWKKRRWRKGALYPQTKEEAKLAYEKSSKIDPFKAKGFTRRYPYRDLAETICNDRFPCPLLVLLYAKMGLHRHNFLKGTNYELNRVMKYNMTTGLPPAASYYITCDAQDPAASSSLTFLTEINEKAYGQFIRTCYYARPQGAADTSTERDCFLGDLPECPPQNPFRDTNGFYLLDESEWQDTAWIRLYLELAVATTNKFTTQDHGLSDLKIVKVAMDTTKDVHNEGLNAKNAIFYIRYKDSCEARVGKDVDRIAIVKRAFKEHTGCFSLVGRNQSSDVLRKYDKKKIPSAQLFFSQRLGVLKKWRLSSPRQLNAFKNRGMGLARRQNRISDKVDKISSSFRRHLGVRKPWPLSTPRQRKSFKIYGLGFARRPHKTCNH